MNLTDAAAALSQAIAHAEGFFTPGSLPARIHNPGDLELGDHGYGVTNKKTNFPTDEAGWFALQNECTLILAGRSHYIKPTMTILQMAVIYTGADAAASWALCVAERLDVDTEATLDSLVDTATTPTP